MSPGAWDDRHLAVLIGIHPVVEALRAQRPLERILVARGAGGHRLQEVIDLARTTSTPLRFEDRGALDRLAGVKSHQGVVALGAEKKYAELDDVAPTAELLVVLDGVEDPHNLGAIIRTANAAAGALEHLPVVQVVNINHTLRSLKDEGYFIYGLDERGEMTYDAVDW